MGRPPFDPSKYLGRKYGRLTIIAYDHEKYIDIRHRRHYFKCRCDCGNEIVTRLDYLTNKHYAMISCGCYMREINAERIKWVNYSHGLTNHRLYHIWNGMKARCYNPNNGSYNDYGARGIKVCDEWLNKETGFITFYNWAISHGYANNLSIDRIDHEGNYCPENCRFASDKLQQSNRRDNVYLTYTKDFTDIGKGKIYFTFTLSDWARILRTSNIMLAWHLRRRGNRSINEVIDNILDIQAKKLGRLSFGFVIPGDGSVIPLPEKYDESLHD